MIIGVLCVDVVYCTPRSSLLRVPLKFNNLELLDRIHSEVVRKMEVHLGILKQRYENGKLKGYSPLPKVRFLSSENILKYEYSRTKNEIVLYVPGQVKDKDFEKICWLAYGDWFSQNESSEYSDEVYGDGVWSSSYIDYLEEQGYASSGEVKDKVILDVGTGPGIPGILIAERGAREVNCLDVSNVMLSLAEKEADKRNLKNIIFKQGSAFQLPFGDNSFDMVFINLMFERQPEELRRIALAEILRVLKPKGRIKFVEMHGLSHPRLNVVGTGWDEGEWSEELKKVGFKNIKVLDRTKLYSNGPMPVVRSISYIMTASKSGQALTNQEPKFTPSTGKAGWKEIPKKESLASNKNVTSTPRPLKDLTWKDEDVLIYFRALPVVLGAYRRLDLSLKEIQSLAKGESPNDFFVSIAIPIMMFGDSWRSQYAISLLDKLTNHKASSSWFVYHEQLNKIVDAARELKSIYQNRPLKIYDYGSAGGGEAYSIALMLNRVFHDHKFEIIGLDMEEQNIGILDYIRYKDIPEDFKPDAEKYFHDIFQELLGERILAFRPEFTNLVELQRGDIRNIVRLEEEPDIIVANGFLGAYVKEDELKSVLGGVFKKLSTGGYFFVDNSNYYDNKHRRVFYDAISIYVQSGKLVEVQPGIYRKPLQRNLGSVIRANRISSENYLASGQSLQVNKLIEEFNGFRVFGKIDKSLLAKVLSWIKKNHKEFYKDLEKRALAKSRKSPKFSKQDNLLYVLLSEIKNHPEILRNASRKTALIFQEPERKRPVMQNIEDIKLAFLSRAVEMMAEEELTSSIRINGSLVKIIKEYLEKRFYKGYLQDKLILNPGCGSGTLMDYLRNEGANVFGVEIATKYVDPDKNIYYADAKNTPFANSVFDITIDSSLFWSAVTHFSQDIDFIAQEIWRVSKPGSYHIYYVLESERRKEVIEKFKQHGFVYMGIPAKYHDDILVFEKPAKRGALRPIPNTSL